MGAGDTVEVVAEVAEKGTQAAATAGAAALECTCHGIKVAVEGAGHIAGAVLGG